MIPNEILGIICEYFNEMYFYCAGSNGYLWQVKVTGDNNNVLMYEAIDNIFSLSTCKINRINDDDILIKHYSQLQHVNLATNVNNQIRMDKPVHHLSMYDNQYYAAIDSGICRADAQYHGGHQLLAHLTKAGHYIYVTMPNGIYMINPKAKNSAKDLPAACFDFESEQLKQIGNLNIFNAMQMIRLTDNVILIINGFGQMYEYNIVNDVCNIIDARVTWDMINIKTSFAFRNGILFACCVINPKSSEIAMLKYPFCKNQWSKPIIIRDRLVHFC